MPRDVSLSDSKCWNGGHEWVKSLSVRAHLFVSLGPGPSVFFLYVIVPKVILTIRKRQLDLKDQSGESGTLGIFTGTESSPLLA